MAGGIVRGGKRVFPQNRPWRPFGARSFVEEPTATPRGRGRHASPSSGPPVRSDLLTTKLHRPDGGPTVVPRPRLTDALESGVDGRLLLVAAPAGFGKSTLVARWLEGREGPAAWVSLEPDDDEPDRFWGYVVAALSPLRPEATADARLRLEAPRPDFPSVANALVNGFATPSGAPVVLVLDDLHAIGSPRVLHDLARLLEQRPAGLRVVATSRTDPALPLARWRARRDLTEIRQDDLRFTLDEARAYFERLGIALPDEALTLLTRRTEGWAASLQLAALSMDGLDDGERRRFVRGFSGDDRFVVDYLVDEVLDRLPSGVHRFLLATSVLDRLSGPLCDAVVDGLPDVDRPDLESLERQGLFVIPLDRRRTWYRYHHLFADLLRFRADEAFDVPRLLRRAAAWCEERGHVEEGVRYALRAADPEAAAGILERCFPHLIGQGRLATLTRLLDELAAGRVEGSVDLCMARAYVEHLSSNRAGAREWIDRARALPLDDDKPGDLGTREGHLALLETFQAMARQDVDAVARGAATARKTFAEIPFMRAVVEQAAALAELSRERLPEADRLGRAAWASGLRGGNRLAGVIGVHTAALAAVAAGRLADAAQLLDDALDRAAEVPRDEPLIRTLLDLRRSEVRIRQGDLDEAAVRIEAALATFEALTYETGLGLALAERLRLALVRGDGAAAAEAARALRPYQRQERVMTLAQPLLADLRWQGAPHADPPVDGGPLPSIVALTDARRRAAEGEHRDAAGRARRVGDDLDAAGAHGWALDARVLEAIQLDRLRDGRAGEVLTSALVAAAPHDHIGPFVMAGSALGDLLARTQARGAGDVPTALVARILAAIDADDGGSDGLLSDREGEVLTFLAAGLSNADIARRLFVSVGTVKRHTHNIYRKLEVSRRTEAVAEARRRGLVD